MPAFEPVNADLQGQSDVFRASTNYKRTVQEFCDSIGLSGSSVGCAFVEASAKALETFETRRLDKEKYVVLFMDGKCL